MKKLVFFIPALIFAAFYGSVIISTGLSVSVAVYLWIAAFLISGILMSKGIVWGSCFGLLPGIHLIYMSTTDTGQIISEMPLGVIVVVFYVMCCISLLFKKRK